jgi:hypothetical protein
MIKERGTGRCCASPGGGGGGVRGEKKTTTKKEWASSNIFPLLRSTSSTFNFGLGKKLFVSLAGHFLPSEKKFTFTKV